MSTIPAKQGSRFTRAFNITNSTTGAAYDFSGFASAELRLRESPTSVANVLAIAGSLASGVITVDARAAEMVIPALSYTAEMWLVDNDGDQVFFFQTTIDVEPGFQ